jgi:hypothetical protein
VSRSGKRSRLDKLQRQQRDGPVRRLEDREPSPQELEARARHVEDIKAAYKQAKADGTWTPDWTPRSTPEGRASINNVLREIRRSAMPPAAAEKDRTEIADRERRARRREEEESDGS